MSLQKPERQSGIWQSAVQSSANLHESVQNNLQVSREQIKRSRQIASHSREIIVKVRRALAQSALIQLGVSRQSPRNPLILGEKIR